MEKNNIIDKFDDIDGKIDFIIELCKTLEHENKDLQLKIKNLEQERDKINNLEKGFFEQETLVQSKIDGLLEKLNSFSNNSNRAISSK